MRRFLPVLLICFLFLVFTIPSVSASEDDSLSMFNLLDYTSLNPDGTNRTTVTGDHTFIFNAPFSSPLSYFDILVHISGSTTNFTASIATTPNGEFRPLNVISVGTNLYRIYGRTSYVSYQNYYLKLESSTDISRNYTFLSFDVSNNQYVYYDLDGQYNYSIDNSPFTPSISFSAGSPFQMDLSSYESISGSERHRFTFAIAPYLVQKFDKIYFSLQLGDIDFDSISAVWDDLILPVDIISSTQFDHNHFTDVSYYVLDCVIDVSSAKLANVNNSTIPSITFNGHFFADQPMFAVVRAYGTVEFEEPSKFNLLMVKIQSLFEDAFGLNDHSASQAFQTQEEINVSVNNQLVTAVEDWNSNIEVVETGYDLAVSKTSPALIWLSSLADGIFNGMGWFGNVYFLVGLISVLMLILSKSGLASKIGSISRRRGD